MSKRSRSFQRGGLEDKRHAGGTEPPAADARSRRATWAARLFVAAAGLIAIAGGSVWVYHAFAADPGSAEKKIDDLRRQEIEELIRRYFRTWSSQDMKGYGECFLDNACIQFIDAQGKIEPSNLPAFLAYQAELLRAGQQETEVPESIDIRFEAKLARVVVYWKLTVGARQVFGYDHFTLLKRNEKWGIVNLVFYETKR
jgi:hypothetical protein